MDFGTFIKNNFVMNNSNKNIIQINLRHKKCESNIAKM